MRETDPVVILMWSTLMVDHDLLVKMGRAIAVLKFQPGQGDNKNIFISILELVVIHICAVISLVSGPVLVNCSRCQSLNECFENRPCGPRATGSSTKAKNSLSQMCNKMLVSEKRKPSRYRFNSPGHEK